MSGHTKGPWVVETEVEPAESEIAEVYVCHPGTVCDVTVVATMGTSQYVSLEQRQANARLIALAPELLALAHQYANDLRYPPTADSIPRRLAAIEAVLVKLEI